MNESSHASQAMQTGASRTEKQLRLLIDLGLRLARESSVDVIVQAALDAGLELSGAAFGAFFYNRTGDDGESYQLYKLTGAAEEAFAGFPLPRPTEIFAHTFVHKGMLRSDDIRRDPRYGRNTPLQGVPQRHIPVASYLAVPVMLRGGEVGAMFYGHPEPGMIPAGSEELVATVAAQAAAAMENAQLAESIQREIAAADRARQMQRETALRLEQMLESTSDGVALLDREWRFTYINRYANQLVAPGRDLTGVNFWELFPADLDGVFHQNYRQAMDEGKTVEFTEFYAPLNIWVFLRVFPTPEGIAIFFQDVTLHKAAERDKTETTQRLRQALDAGRLGTWIWDRETDMLDYDERAAEIWSVPAHKPISRTELRQKMVHPEDLAQTPANLRELLEREGKYSAEYRIMTPKNGIRWIASTAIASRAEGTNELIGMSGTFQDVTDRKTQEATLRQSEKLAATGRLAATIAHEINNPLEAVTNLIFLCKTDPAVPPPIQRMLEMADDELARVAQIAQQTLGFYRDTARPAEIDVAALLASVVDLFSRKLLSKKVVCTLDVARDLRIVGLQGEIKQVFSNLLVNAIDASGANATIRIRGKSTAHEGKRGVSVLMADEGSGIPVHVRERLFSPFFTTKESLGTGLGLWVTRGIIEKQGGRIDFRTCTDPPTGTVFRVFLPSEFEQAEMLNSPQPRFLQ